MFVPTAGGWMATHWKMPTRNCSVCGRVTPSWRPSGPPPATCFPVTWASRYVCVQSLAAVFLSLLYPRQKGSPELIVKHCLGAKFESFCMTHPQVHQRKLNRRNSFYYVIADGLDLIWVLSLMRVTCFFGIITSPGNYGILKF